MMVSTRIAFLLSFKASIQNSTNAGGFYERGDGLDVFYVYSRVANLIPFCCEHEIRHSEAEEAGA